MDRLSHWERFLESIGTTEEAMSLGFAVLLEEAKTQAKEDQACARTGPFDQRVRWVHWLEIPAGASLDAPLGLYCEKGYVIPVGTARMHLQFCPSIENEPMRSFFVQESGVDPGPIEMHAKTCTCTLKVKPFGLGLNVDQAQETREQSSSSKGK